WRNILKLHPLIRHFIWHKIGDGSGTLVWFDRWCELSPLAAIVTSRDIFRDGFSSNSKVYDLMRNGGFLWPPCWSSKYPSLFSIPSPTLVWHRLKALAGLHNSSDLLDEVISDILPFAARKSSKSIIAKLVVAATSYFIWQERNGRLFKNSKRTVNQVVECILHTVRLKLMSCCFRKTRSALEMIKAWNISESVLQRVVILKSFSSIITRNLNRFWVSLPKSIAFFCNVSNAIKASILSTMPFTEGSLLVRYLGVPFISSRLLYHDCKVLVEKLKCRINDWRNKFLSFVGRLQLIRYVLSSMHIYWASVFILPVRIIHDLEQLMRGFLWCQGEMEKRKAKVAWESVCVTKHEVGLGMVSEAFFVACIWDTIRFRADVVRVLCGMDSIPSRIKDVLAFIIPFSKEIMVVSILSRIMIAATSYYLGWKEMED
nr:reverse transcriptase domain, reverse transcriptase zinc-binding domain protein [Tanacetum cinerariifolium]GEY15899.1 reverse transcriptase domain, reverse transcriptase zinc-binding domain protein [Tanacetum cinerariifolium]